MASLLELNNIDKIYGNKVKTQVLYDVNLKVEESSFTSIVGASGSGDNGIIMTDTINPVKSRFKGFHKTFKQDDLGLNLSSFLLN